MSPRAHPGLSAEQVERIRDGLRRRETVRDPVGMRAVDRIEIDVVAGLSYSARNLAEPDGVMAIGEPVERGGTGEGASPLSHFLTGAGSCLLNQFIRVSMAEGYQLAFEGVRVRGEFRRDPGAGFQRITCEIRASGEVDDVTAEALTQRAERLCYVHSTLARSVEMTTALVVNGHERVRRTAGPSAATTSDPTRVR